MSPSKYLVTKAHAPVEGSILPKRELENWKEGNPTFKPYRIPQLVLRKEVFKGRNLVDKLRERFVGPYEIVAVRPNKVTYIVRHCESGHQQRAHYSQLRRYYQPPKYLRKHPAVQRITASGAEDDSDQIQETDLPRNDSIAEGLIPRTSAALFFIVSSTEDSDSTTDDETDSSEDQYKAMKPVEEIETQDWSKLYEDICQVEREFSENRKEYVRKEREMLQKHHDPSQEMDVPSWSLTKQSVDFWTFSSSNSSKENTSIAESHEQFSGEDSYFGPRGNEDDDSSMSVKSERMVNLTAEDQQKLNKLRDSTNLRGMSGSVDYMVDLQKAAQATAGIYWLSHNLAALDLAPTTKIAGRVHSAVQQVIYRRESYSSKARSGIQSKSDVEKANISGIEACDEQANVEEDNQVEALRENSTHNGHHRMKTRSMGTVEDHQNVQRRTLEYKERKRLKD